MVQEEDVGSDEGSVQSFWTQSVNEEVEVRVIQRRGDTITVEWMDEFGIARAVLPMDTVLHDGVRVSGKELSRGVRLGIWEALLEPISITPEMLASELRRMGVWTLDDITSAKVEAAVRRVTGLCASTVVKQLLGG